MSRESELSTRDSIGLVIYGMKNAVPFGIGNGGLSDFKPKLQQSPWMRGAP